ncbi:long-chain fatty acid--CoA ligase [Desulfosarcina ovata subsp. sediminis]|uniref:Long-chain fatty acid--CoA ligase n=1 Tax=Desulfosarcina ovata subsp. sediminis TaxID=885957 RepID=A0A5K7ZI18_9BACT|nr:AMP-binding protein [Desulfosarcina ovata]BBO80994.1 long-chain fatty acid--CoA ligase [Desulfosarcina ovata subsp. sediminis]
MKWSVGKILSKRALLTPDKTAIVFEDTPITYKMLDAASNRIARFLQDRGLKRQDRVAVDLFNCPELIACYFAAAKLGLIFVPLNYRQVSEELAYQLNHADCRLLLFHSGLQPYIEKIRFDVPVQPGNFVQLRQASTPAVDLPEWAVDYNQTMEGYPDDAVAPASPVGEDDPLMILYTSGVSGFPKGAVISHAQTYFKNFQIIIHTDMREADVFLSQCPLCHSAGIAAVVTPVLCRGATLIMREKFDPRQFGRDIETYRATIVFALTTMLRFVLDTGVLDGIDHSSVRVLLGGGERTPDSLVYALAEKGLYLQMGYGQTENSGMSLMPRDYVLEKTGSCGFANFFTDVWVEDEDGEPAPPGDIGHIVATGPNVMSGYWNAPETTAATIVNGKLYTGDLGYTDADGFLYHVDRSKDMYRSGGENVYPAEVERVLAGHPAIENVAIIGVHDNKWGETGKAFIVPKNGTQLSAADVRNFLDGKVAKYKHPKQVVFVDSFPLSSWGKVKKAELKNGACQQGK